MLTDLYWSTYIQWDSSNPRHKLDREVSLFQGFKIVKLHAKAVLGEKKRGFLISGVSLESETPYFYYCRYNGISNMGVLQLSCLPSLRALFLQGWQSCDSHVMSCDLHQHREWNMQGRWTDWFDSTDWTCPGQKQDQGNQTFAEISSKAEHENVMACPLQF